jgi:hypothetical protein
MGCKRLEKTNVRGQVVNKVRKAPDSYKSFRPKSEREKTLWVHCSNPKTGDRLQAMDSVSSLHPASSIRE